jgi:hypothetical protein
MISFAFGFLAGIAVLLIVLALIVGNGWAKEFEL